MACSQYKRDIFQTESQNSFICKHGVLTYPVRNGLSATFPDEAVKVVYLSQQHEGYTKSGTI
jgi:uncharacterized protein YbaR (Trm112 family)